MESKILLEESSPYGNIVAVVEDLGNTVYFYLYGPEDVIPFGESPDSWIPMRSCWICNTDSLSDFDEVDRNKILATMEQGLAPVMPAKHCRHAKTGLKLDKSELEVVWFEEGDCAALLHKGEIIAVIPPWATPSISEYIGYAKEFKGEQFLGMGCLDEILEAIEQRVRGAQNFWAKWSHPETWENFQATYMKILESNFGTHTHYICIDEGDFPPKGIAVFEKEDSVFFVTIGMSIFAQPRTELFTEHPEQFRRIELAMAIDKGVLKQRSIEQIGQSISSFAVMPWDEICWFGHSHCLQSDLFQDNGFNHFLFFDKGLDSAILPLSGNDPVKLLWMLPITDKEFDYKQKHSAESLIKKLEEGQNAWVYKPRPSAI